MLCDEGVHSRAVDNKKIHETLAHAYVSMPARPCGALRSVFGSFPVLRMAILRPPPPRPGKVSQLEKVGVPLCTCDMVAKADTRHTVSQTSSR